MTDSPSTASQSAAAVRRIGAPYFGYPKLPKARCDAPALASLVATGPDDLIVSPHERTNDVQGVLGSAQNYVNRVAGKLRHPTT